MSAAAALAIGGLLLVACEAQAPGAGSGPAAQPGAPESGAAASPAGPAAGEPQTVADVFPPGPGRDQLLNSCGSCHNVACAAIGQRTAQRWDALREGHKEHMQGADTAAVFAYLKANFDDSKPEPRIPARFLEGGCTPF